ncbi:MAG: iron chelate uptake ABC transporter family permease subunit [Flavobacterium psychrophilum]
MSFSPKHITYFALLFILVGLLFCADLSMGAVAIPGEAVWQALTGSSQNSSWDYIVLAYRLPKAITALFVGMGLSVSGLLMQTLFRNPLAGPYVLGLSSGSSLGVAVVIMGAAVVPPQLSSILQAPYSIILASCVGSLVVLLAVLVAAQRLKDTMAILVVGLMFGSFSSALVAVLSYFSSAEALQKFTFWSLGSLGNLGWDSIGILGGCVALGLLLSLYTIKALNALLLGENYAKTLGIKFTQTKYILIVATAILAGSITAYVGPIAFIGLAVPHLAKLVFQTSQHQVLFIATILLGAAVLLLCDILTQLPGTSIFLPINAITSIIGAPIVIWLLVKKQRL